MVDRSGKKVRIRREIQEDLAPIRRIEEVFYFIINVNGTDCFLSSPSAGLGKDRAKAVTVILDRVRGEKTTAKRSGNESREEAIDGRREEKGRSER